MKGEAIWRGAKATLKLALGVAAIEASGCATTPPPPPPPPPPPQALQPLSASFAGESPGPGAEHRETAQSAQYGKIDITRYIGVDASNWKANSNRDLSDLYTTVVVRSIEETQGASSPQQSPYSESRNYHAEKRTFLERWLSGRTITLTTIARLEVKAPDLVATVPLFSVTHASTTGTGEAWSTNLTSTDVQSPLFRVGPNTRLTLHLNAALSDSTKSQYASQLIGVVQQALTIASPQSSLLTTLSSPTINNNAQALDGAISGLLSEQITEDIAVGRFMSAWVDGASLRVTGLSPAWVTRGYDPSKSDKRVGTWDVSFSCPRPSAFTTLSICDAAEPSATSSSTPPSVDTLAPRVASSVKDQTVLQFMLSTQVTVQQFIQTQSWFTPFVQNANKNDTDYNTFCMNAISGLYAAGLSHLVSALVLRATIDQMPGLGDSKTRNGIADHCQPLVGKLVTLSHVALDGASGGAASPAGS